MSNQKIELLAYMKEWTILTAQTYGKDTAEIEAVLETAIDAKLSELAQLGYIAGNDISYADVAEMIQTDIVTEFKTEAAITKMPFRILVVGRHATGKGKTSGKHNVTAVVWVYGENDPNMAIKKAKISAFEDANFGDINVKKVEGLKSLESYSAVLQYRKEEMDANGELGLSAVKDTEFVPAEFEPIPSTDMKRRKEIVIKNYPLIELAQATANKSKQQKDTKFTDPTDLRVIKVSIKEVSITTSKDGVDNGRYAVMDSSYMKSKFINFSVFISPRLIEEADCGVGSQVQILGTIDINSTNGEPSMRAVAVIPIMRKPLSDEYKGQIQKPEQQAVSGGISLD
jgi:hypothetical protein